METETLIPVVGSSFFIKSDDENYKKAFGVWGKTHKIEPVLGTSPDLRKLLDNQRVMWGDGKKYHFRLTELPK